MIHSAKTKLLACILAALLILPLFPVGMISSYADTAVASSTTSFADGQTYVVSSNVTMNDRITVEGTAVLVLNSGKTLTAPKGIFVASGKKLTIRGEGTLIATGDDCYAGIGGNYSGGQIVIEGGNITATGGKYAAGIGGGQRSPTSGDIWIKGGNVTATGGQYGAGIGGGGNNNWAGNYASCGNITISGGTVVATGNDGGAGIGGGGASTNGSGAGNTETITIAGGNVTATANGDGVGIGCGVNKFVSSNSGTSSTIILGVQAGSQTNLEFTASSYRGSVSTQTNLAVLDGSEAYTGTFTEAQLSALAGKTLVTFENPRVMERINIGGTGYYVYSGFTATAGVTGYNGQSYEKLVDGNMNTKYCVGTTTPYVEFYREAGGIVPQGYIFTTAEDGYKYANRNPKTWTLYGKVNESDSWTTLSSVSNDTTLKGINRTNYVFPIDYSGTGAPAEAAYKYFRFEVSALNGAPTFQLMELRLYCVNPPGEFVPAKAASCTESGISQDCYRRSDGAYFADVACMQPLDTSAVEIPALGHSMTHHEAVPASCTTEGSVECYECSVCRKIFSDASGANELTAAELGVPATGHTMTYHAAVPATCTTAGSVAYYECSGCHKYFSDAAGANELTAAELGVPAIGHTMTYHAAVPAFCTTAGSVDYYECSNCHKYFSDAAGTQELTAAELGVPATGHTMTYHVFVAATETEAGNVAYYECSGCHKYFSDAAGTNELTAAELIIPATGHSLTYHEAVAATCTEAGSFAYYECSGCHKYFSDAAGANELTAEELVVPATGHSLTFREAVPATCTAAGNAAYYECSGCHKYFSDAAGTNELTAAELIIPATGHSLTYHAAVAPTLTEEGCEAYYECSVCRKLFAEESCTTELSEIPVVPIPYTTVTVNGVTYILYAGFTATSGTSGYTNQGYANLVDDDLNNKFCCGGTMPFVEFHADSGFIPLGYVLTTGGDTATYPGRNPKNWTIKAKVNENDEWTTLTVVTNDKVLGATNLTDYYFAIDYNDSSIPSGGGYQYFRFEADALQNGTTFQLTELRFYGYEALSDCAGHLTARAATCMETGIAQECYYNYVTCKYYADSACTQELDASNVVIPLAPHTPVHHPAVPHTDSVNGNYEYWSCSVCGKLFSDSACTTETTQFAVTDFAPIPYLNEQGQAASLTERFLPVDGVTEWSSGWYVLMENQTISGRIIVTGTVNLLLCDGATLTAYTGISVTNGNALNIYAQSTGDNKGVLNASSETTNAAIGGAAGQSSGQISIYGGKINAASGFKGAGIGGGENGHNGTVLIAGGHVVASGGTGNSSAGGAGIGGGYDRNGGTITITGGIVEATGGSYAAGIGGGVYGHGGTITITGGNVTASGLDGAAGIGAGACYASASGGVITITGGIVNAYSSTDGSRGSAAIGGSNKPSQAGRITITGGQITTHTSNDTSVGIGNGYAYSGTSESSVSISLTNAEDFVYIPRIQASNVTIGESLVLQRTGCDEVIADSHNVLDGGTLRVFTGTICTVSYYDADSAAVIESISVPSGVTVPACSCVPPKSGYILNGWNDENGNPADMTAAVTTNLVLVADWIPAPPLSYLDENGNTVTTTDYGTITAQDYTITLRTGVYTFAQDAVFEKSFILTGSVTFILQNGVSVTAKEGVWLLSDATLTIYGQAVGQGETAGELNVSVTTDEGRPGIGWIETASEGALIAIHGGKVSAQPRYYGAGIGVGRRVDGSNAFVLITGGEVTAKNGSWSAAIGGAEYSTFGGVTITGGVVNATCVKNYGAAIGGGYQQSGGVITITGGIVHAKAYSDSPAIGGGYGGAAGTIIISGGVIIADGVRNGACIGCGKNANGGSVTISGGQVTCNSLESGCYGIGGAGANGGTVIKLGYTDPDNDFIIAADYRGSVSFLNSMKIDGSDPIVIAKADNIAGNKLVASGLPDVTVTFVDEDGVTVLATQTCFPGGTASAIAAPGQPGRAFNQWTYEGAVFDFATVLTSDITLIAEYITIPTPSGSGTENDPYLIATTEDWELFADMVNTYGLTLWGTYTVLTSDNVTVTKLLGTSSVKYAGTFDGGGHTLHLNINSTEVYAAPFSCVQGATIRHLVTDGTVRSSAYHASGLVGSSTGVTILDCVVSASILFDSSMTAVHSGSFIGHAGSSPFTIEGCVFNGTLGYDGSGSGLTNVGGLVGWDDASAPNIKNCLNLGSFTSNGNKIAPIARVNGRGSVTNCYTTVSTTSNGSQNDNRGTLARIITAGEDVAFSFANPTVYTVSGITAAAKGILYGGQVYASDDQTIAIAVTYTGSVPSENRAYTATSGTVTFAGDNISLKVNGNATVNARAKIDIATLVYGANDLAYSGNALTPIVWIKNGSASLLSGIDFTYTVTPAAVVEIGEYTVAFTGIGAYKGSASATFTVENHDPNLLNNIEDGWYVNMPEGSNVTMSLDLTGESDGFTVKVFDHGGKNGNYSNSQDSYLNITAPAGYFLAVTGGGTVEGGNYDYLVFYNDFARTDRLGSEKYNGDNFTVTVNGDRMLSSGNTLCIYFHSDSSKNKTGYELNVTLIDSSTMRTVSFSAGGGSGSMSPITVLPGTEIAIPACGFTAPEGKKFDCWTDGTNDYDSGDKLTVNENITLTATYVDMVTVTYVYGSQTETEQYAKGSAIELAEFSTYFTLPSDAQFDHWAYNGNEYDEYDYFLVTENVTFTAVVSVAPALIDDGEGGYYVLIPESGTRVVDLTDRAKGFSIKVYDDGYTANYLNDSDGYLTICAPAGMILLVEGESLTESYYDGMYFYDGDVPSSGNMLGIGEYSGSFTISGMLTTGNALTINFYADDTVNKSGCELTVTLIDPADLPQISYVYFDGNAGVTFTQSMANGVMQLPDFEDVLDSVTLPENMCFKCWKIGNVEYPVGSDYNVSGDVAFEAVIIVKPTITFNGNGQPLQSDSTTTVYGPYAADYGRTDMLPPGDRMFTVPDGMAFGGWTANGKLYHFGEEFTLTEDIVFTAYWYDPSPWTDLAAFLAAGQDGDDLGIYTLTADAVAPYTSGPLVVGSGVTVVIDLAGYKIDRALGCGRSDGVVFAVYGNLTIVDSSAGGAGMITGGNTQYEATGSGSGIGSGSYVPITSGSGSTYYGGGIYLAENASLTLNGGTICGNKATSGGGVYMAQYSNFTLNGGAICDNEAYSGGGVYLSYAATITMNNGAIENNAATGNDSNNSYNNVGGGVYLRSNSTFTMNGGAIRNNAAWSGDRSDYSDCLGGGVLIEYGVFTMTAGEISGNSAGYGGAVEIYGGSFVMTGGVITGNEAIIGGGGAIDAAYGTITVSGAVRITGNTRSYINNNGQEVIIANNVILYQNGSDSRLLYVDGDLTGALIGISMYYPVEGDSTFEFTYDFNGQSISCFTSDSSDLEIMLDEDTGEAYLIGRKTVPGDVNGDGNLDITDVTDLLNYLAGLNTANAARCDVNGDGGVNITDVTDLLNILAGLN